MNDDIDDWEEQCTSCGESHSDWEKVGSHTIDEEHHRGVADRWECGKCGETMEVHRP